jgi:hypothetical protein
MTDNLKVGDQEQQAPSVADPVVEEASQPFVGRWNQLVSTTNWEKGHIITEWRDALHDAGAPATEYSDEAWARRVGGVTGQHVGRLRRVYQRFANVCEDYPGLYWSHFHAALDWDDAEMWLEGAVQARWSVSQMRRQRWEAMGAIAEETPQDEEVVVAEKDEDFEPALEQEPIVQQVSGELAEVHGPSAADGTDSGSSEEAATAAESDSSASIYADERPEETVQFVRPFENLGELPDDLAEAFESFKLAILRHKADDWRQISREDVLAALDALKELAIAPSMD